MRKQHHPAMAAVGKPQKHRAGAKKSKKVSALGAAGGKSRPQLSAEDAELLAAADAVESEAVELPRRPLRKRQRAQGGEDSLGESAATATQSSASSSGPSDYKEKQSLFQTGTSFSKLGLARWLAESCEKLGMHHPTDIQVMSIPHILAGKNIAGNARTGSGKTAAYCLPILHHLSKDPYGVFALVLCPVRELAYQVTENFRALGQGIGIQVGEIVGGRDFSIQSQMIADRNHV
ncbi:unnamed protein product, partial [Polarella glacialis]